MALMGNSLLLSENLLIPFFPETTTEIAENAGGLNGSTQRLAWVY